jgi:Ca-activated chloride channel family protein
VLLVVTDGEDNQSMSRLEDVIKQAQSQDLIIFAVSTNASGLVMRGDRVLSDLASKTGGRAFFPQNHKQMKKSFAAIRDELRNQYVVDYKPENMVWDGRFRTIQISAPSKPKIRIRARTGYFATGG